MYLPSHFEESRPEVLHALLRNHPLGLLLTQNAQADANGFQPLQADSIPFMLDPARGAHGTLVAHVARANPLWKAARTDAQSVVVFQGAQAYVSPAWYATKAETGKVVPTWNYVMVEVRGRLRVIDDAAWVHQLVSTLTDRHEAQRASAVGEVAAWKVGAWKVTDAPDDYIATMQRAIVGIEIEIESIQGKWKVSQNRSAADRAGVAAGLAQQGQTDIAALSGGSAG
jgi:transcriptional regulator